MRVWGRKELNLGGTMWASYSSLPVVSKSWLCGLALGYHGGIDGVGQYPRFTLCVTYQLDCSAPREKSQGARWAKNVDGDAQGGLLYQYARDR